MWNELYTTCIQIVKCWDVQGYQYSLCSRRFCDKQHSCRWEMSYKNTTTVQIAKCWDIQGYQYSWCSRRFCDKQYSCSSRMFCDKPMWYNYHWQKDFIPKCYIHLPCNAHFSQQCPFHPTISNLPCYVHFTLLCPFYPAMSILPFNVQFTNYFRFTLPCPFYPSMSISVGYAHFTITVSILPCNVHFTLLCPFYPALPIYPYYAHFTLLCLLYPAMSIYPYYVHFNIMCPFYLLCPFHLAVSICHVTTCSRSQTPDSVPVHFIRSKIRSLRKNTMSTCYACQFEGISLGFPPLGYCETPHGYCNMAIAQMWYSGDSKRGSSRGFPWDFLL